MLKMAIYPPCWLCKVYGQNFGPGITYFAIKIPNSDCVTSESKLTVSFATSSTDFSSESDPSSSTESSELETDSDNNDLSNS